MFSSVISSRIGKSVRRKKTRERVMKSGNGSYRLRILFYLDAGLGGRDRADGRAAGRVVPDDEVLELDASLLGDDLQDRARDDVGRVVLVVVELDDDSAVQRRAVVRLVLFLVVRVQAVRHVRRNLEAVAQQLLQRVRLGGLRRALRESAEDALDRVLQEHGVSALEALRTDLLVVEERDHVDVAAVLEEARRVDQPPNREERREQVVEASRRDELLRESEVP